MRRAFFIAFATLGLAACANLRVSQPTSRVPDVGATGEAGSATGAARTGVGAGAGGSATGSGVSVTSGTAAIDSGALPREAAWGGVALPPGIPASVRRFVTTALRMLGQPYRRGGSAPGGFDCSGLVAYAGHEIGLGFPRTTHEQQYIGKPVARSALEPGDLVFMRLRGRQHHVGIMIDTSHFVHAPSSGGRVRVDSLDVNPYAKRLFAARRPDFPP